MWLTHSAKSLARTQNKVESKHILNSSVFRAMQSCCALKYTSIKINLQLPQHPHMLTSALSFSSYHIPWEVNVTVTILWMRLTKSRSSCLSASTLYIHHKYQSLIPNSPTSKRIKHDLCSSLLQMLHIPEGMSIFYNYLCISHSAIFIINL